MRPPSPSLQSLRPATCVPLKSVGVLSVTLTLSMYCNISGFFVVCKCSCAFRCWPHAVVAIFMLHAFVANFCCLFHSLLLIACCHHSFTHSLVQRFIHSFIHSDSLILLFVLIRARFFVVVTRGCCCRFCCLSEYSSLLLRARGEFAIVAGCCSDSLSRAVGAIDMTCFLFLLYIVLLYSLLLLLLYSVTR